MKFRFQSSDKLFELPTTKLNLAVHEISPLLQKLFFKDKPPTCSFKVTNYEVNHVLDCVNDILIVKRVFEKLFVKATAMKMVEKPKKKKRKKRWKSRSPIKRRWRSRSPVYRERWG
tara:strand:+ start:285 stop:632 length:348 start_codon:yes stop_codon:yes gene_type:complete